MNPVIKDQFGNIVNTSYISNTKQPQAPAKKQMGGLAGILTGIAKDIAHPVGYFGDAAFGNPIRELSAQFTGNKVALANANKRSNKNLGIGDNADNLLGGLKTLAGNAGQLGLSLLAPETKSIKAGMTVGAGFGGSSALSRNGSLEDVINQAGTGALFGGALSVGGKVIGRLSGRGGSETSKLAQSSQRLEGRSTGIGFGTKVNGQRISAQQAKELEQFGISQGMPSGHIDNKFAWAGAKKSELAKNLEDVVKANNRPLTPQESNDLVFYIKKRLSENLVLKNDKPTMKLAKSYLKDVFNASDIVGTNNAKKAIASAESFAKQSKNATPNTQNVYEIFRDELSKVENSIKPIAKANKSFGQISTLNEAIGQEAAKVGNASNGSSGSIIGMLKGGDAAQAVKSKAGRAGLRLSGTTPGPTTQPSALSGILSGIPRMGLAAHPITGPAAIRTSQPQSPAQMDQSQGQDIYGQAGGQNTTGMSGVSGYSGAKQPQQAPQSAYSYEQAIRDLNSTNNPKFQQQIMERYNFVSKAEEARNKPAASPFGKPTFQQYTMAKSGVNSLQQIEKLIKQSPELVNKGNVPGQGIPIVGGYVQKSLGTNQYKALSHNLIDTVLRIRTGAQANAQEIALYSRDLMPQAGDPPETVQSKLQTLYDFLNTAASVGDNKSNLSSAIGGQ